VTTTLTLRYEGVRITERNVREVERDIIEPDLDRRATNAQAVIVRGAPKRTARLASTVRKNRGRTATGPHVDVITGRAGMTDYLGFILNGTPPHIIRAIENRPNAHLRFMVGGQVVFAKLVRHPGTRPDNFIARALPVALR
jgi:hypothetical protein